MTSHPAADDRASQADPPPLSAPVRSSTSGPESPQSSKGGAVRIYHFLAFKQGRECQCSLSDREAVLTMAKHLHAEGWTFRVMTEVGA